MENNAIVKKQFNSNNQAENYDLSAKKSSWYAPEIAFGLSYQYINQGESIIDIGIGTGLSSCLYKKAGLQVHGIDFSEKMLQVCDKKKIAADLKQHDLSLAPYPYKKNSVNHAISTGVFHIFNDLSIIFEETGRIIQRKGIFVFSVIDRNEDENREEIIQSHHIPNGQFILYRHGHAEINDLLKKNDFCLLSCLDFTAIHANRKKNFKMYLTQLG